MSESERAATLSDLTTKKNLTRYARAKTDPYAGASSRLHSNEY